MTGNPSYMDSATEFNVLVTVDRNLSFQQNLPVSIAVIILRANINRLSDLQPLVPECSRPFRKL